MGTSENDTYTKTGSLLGRDFEVAASINELYEQISIILTSNKRPKSWGDLVGEQGIVMTTLDRLLHREIIQMDEDSYRMRNRSVIFEPETKDI